MKVYVQCGEFKKIYTGDSRQACLQSAMIDMVEEEIDINPFMMTSERGFYSDIMKVFGEDSDEIEVSLSYKIAQSVIGIANGELADAWLELAESLRVQTEEADLGEGYKELVANLT